MNKDSTSIKINFPNSASVGWIYFTVKSTDSEITIYLSDLFNPVFEITYLFFGMINGYDDQSIDIDEEGTMKVVRILPEKENMVRFQIDDYDYGEPDEDDPEYPRQYINVVIDRDVLLKMYFTEFNRFIQNDFVIKRWRGTNLKEYYINAIRKIMLTLNEPIIDSDLMKP